MGKNNRNGQAEILRDTELDRIYRHLKSPAHKLFFQIARYTGERFGAICQLKVCDVYVCFSGTREPLKEITFRASTRKAAPDGTRETRQAFICDRLYESLRAYRGDLSGEWLFPSRIHEGLPITWSAADKWLRTAVEKAGMEHRGISGHSLRRSFITQLYRHGMDLHAIQQITGHKDLQVVQRYIGIDPLKLRDSLNKVFA
ncbi:tyrosine-type recombinase/integrase [Pseudanabaena sp. PCC 6802]|uniref:tyrosine-type recombinase/integrase n=1 Tax=Pseudanabaena sp. PCC 6802 TaxID=118173 RepID=UPI0003459BF2|nr:tyrosine-type recombinase/integrase [Pseudanabaena sp. PCC 6802]